MRDKYRNLAKKSDDQVEFVLFMFNLTTMNIKPHENILLPIKLVANTSQGLIYIWLNVYIIVQVNKIKPLLTISGTGYDRISISGYTVTRGDITFHYKTIKHWKRTKQ